MWWKVQSSEVYQPVQFPLFPSLSHTGETSASRGEKKMGRNPGRVHRDQNAPMLPTIPLPIQFSHHDTHASHEEGDPGINHAVIHSTFPLNAALT